ncbi:MAG: aminotransferase class I/II-fold pyridoxal phosphate-dependent enzyme, partial [Gammaproteobacteria bacterium]|nr:aminotransferase class I/II-fold pyridoxal phosphate-dependent enzyme [Gammaproteobacteria bacterium]
MTSAFRQEIERIEQNGITKVAFSRFDDTDVIPLWFGEGDLVTPDFIRDAAKTALDDGHTFYVHTCGLPELRLAVKRYLDRLYGLDIHPDRVTVPGATMLGVTMAAQTALGRGDHALIVSPAWPNIEAVFQVTGAEIGHVRQRLTPRGWRLDLEELFAAVRPNTRAVYVNSPCNPTGWVMAGEEQRRLLAFCRERTILLISDEVYPRTVFDGARAPPSSRRPTRT